MVRYYGNLFTETFHIYFQNRIQHYDVEGIGMLHIKNVSNKIGDLDTVDKTH